MGNFTIADITPEDALQVLGWKYEPPYDFYNIRSKSEAMQEFLMGSYYSVYKEDELVGVFCIGESAKVPEGIRAGVYKESRVDVGVGMSPVLTGQGKGMEFFESILSYLQRRFPEADMRLSVASFNKRAIKLYQNCGFTQQATFQSKDHEFIVMTRT